MSGLVLTSGGLTAMITSFGANFFPPILETVEALAPWIVAVAGAVAAVKLVKRFIGRVMGAGR